MTDSNIDQRGQTVTGGQTNVISTIHISPTPSASQLLEKGIQLLNQRAYRQATEVLKDAVKANPSFADSYFYLALALLEGKKPKDVDQWTVQDIEENLRAAVCVPNQELSHIFVIWALVRYGHYSMNGFIEPAPTSAELLSYVSAIQVQRVREILFHISDPANVYWMSLYNSQITEP